jgi:BRCT domain type II-containing protein
MTTPQLRISDMKNEWIGLTKLLKRTEPKWSDGTRRIGRSKKSLPTGHSATQANQRTAKHFTINLP